MRFQDPDAVPVIVFTTTTVGNVKWVNWDYKTWEEEQFDACRARKTSMSKTPEWCVSKRSSIKIDKVVTVKELTCGKCPFKYPKPHPYLKCWAEKKGLKCPCEA